jgi:hypothetical protein
MQLRGRLLSALTGEDFASLVLDGTPESLTLEFKRDLPSDEETDKSRFVRQVTAMANALGGLIVFGIDEIRVGTKHTGRAGTVIGVDPSLRDESLRRLDMLIRDRTDPPLSQCLVRDFDLPTGETVIAVGIPKSAAGPHAAVGGRSGTYWRRSPSGIYAVPAAELRRMFLQRGQWHEELELFRRERIHRAMNRADIPTPRLQGSTFLHILPLGRLTEWINIVSHAGELMREDRLPHQGFSGTPNADGYLLSDAFGSDRLTRVQWLRCGGVELHTNVYHTYMERGGESLHYFEATNFGMEVIRMAQQAIAFMSGPLSVDPPYAVMLSLRDLRGARFNMNGWQQHALPWGQFEDDELLLPPLILDDTPASCRDAVMPLLDVVWQAAGYLECFLRRQPRSSEAP